MTPMSGPHTNNNKGFTIIEFIVTLLLVGILAAISTVGVTQVTRAYLFVRESAGITQDSQLVLNRMGRSIKNLTAIETNATDTHATRLTLHIFRDNADVKESYYLAGDTLKLDTRIDAGPTVTNLLAENVANFQIQYFDDNAAGLDWLNTRTPETLREIQVNLTLALSSGTNVPFSQRAVPRNVYRPLTPADFSGSGGGLENVSCFISEATGDNMVVKEVFDVLSTLSGRYLSFLITHGAGRLLSVALLVLAGWVVIRRLKIALEEKLLPRGQRGGTLLGIVVTMVVIGILGAAMVSIIGISERSTVASMFNQRAYYLAESAYRYAAYTYLKNDGDPQSLVDLNTKNVFQTRDGNNALSDSFEIFTESYWFQANKNSNDAFLEVRPAVRYPATYQSTSVNGYIVIDRTTTGRELVSYSVNFPASLGTQELTLTLPTNKSVSKNTHIYPASRLSGLDTLKEGNTLSLQDDIHPFPERNGVVWLVKTQGTPAPEDDKIYALLYETADAGATQLKNVKSAMTSVGKIPSGGLVVNSDDYVYVDQNVRITARGIAGSNDYTARRELHIYQPLLRVNMVIRKVYEDRFDNLSNWKTGTANGELGTHAIVGVDDQGVETAGANTAMKVAETDTKTSTSALEASYFGKGVQESSIEIDPAFPKFSDSWSASGMKLSYEMQVKVSFTKDDDKNLSNPLGTYMPGMLFRVRPTETDSTLREYYGLSIVRSIFTQGCAATNPDFDDIPDEDLFDDHGQNDAISVDASKICVDDYTIPPPWNDTPPLSGVPYMMVWQQAVDITEYDNGVWRKDTSGQALMLDWLSYVPMCGVSAPVTVYHYKAYSGPKGEVYKAYIREDSGDPWYLFNEMPNCEWNLFGYYAYKKFNICGNTNNCTGGCTDTDYYWVCEPGRYKNCGDCDTFITLPEGVYEGRLSSSDPRYNNAYYETAHTAYKLTDTYTIFETDSVDGKTILGNATDYNPNYLVRHPGTIDYGTGYAGDIIENTAYVFPNEHVGFQRDRNYRMYLKPWVTLMTRIIELKDNFFDENDVGCTHSQATDERSNLIEAWFANPDNYSRGDTIQWPDAAASLFTHVVWPETAYSSRMDSIQKGSGWTSVDIDKRLCERGKDDFPSDSQKRSATLISNQLTTPENYHLGQWSEVGLHTFGIDASDPNVANRETVYFDDFGLVVLEQAQKTGLLPGMQYE